MRRTLSLLLLASGVVCAGAAEKKPKLDYAKRETREATKEATLKHYEDPSPAIQSLLQYRLDSDFPPSEEAEYYRLLELPIPDEITLEVGALEAMPDGRLAVSTRRGDIYVVEHAFENPPYRAEFKQFATGLHEVLGLAYHDGWLYATQRPEVSRLKDLDGDGRADLVETVNDDWGVSGDYHEYAFGSKFDPDGYTWVALTLTGSFTSEVPYRGWALRISPDGEMIPTCSGLRSPGGLGMNAEGEMFYTDNQGPWNGTSVLNHLVPGKFMGHPIGNKWYKLTDALKPRPKAPKSGSRIHIEAERIPQLQRPAIFFPYNKMGQSASGIACDTTGGKFGPFEEQLFVSDQTHSTVMRVYLEKVNGHYQGACFPFRQGFGSGNVPELMTDDGTLFVGGTDRGWGARGGEPYALEKLVWTGKVPFEVREMNVLENGFELTFTKPVDRSSALSRDSYKFETYTYIYRSDYGSPEVDHTQPEIRDLSVSEDRKAVTIESPNLQIGHVHELHLDGLRSKNGRGLLHPVAYYTLFEVP